MKVYISADIEGTAGIASWSATNLGDPEHHAAAQEMTLEAVAACQGALDAGATELYVKDAHDSGRNMDLSLFPREAKVIFDWSLTPDSMVAGLDGSFDALMFVGYHSPAAAGKPLEPHHEPRKQLCKDQRGAGLGISAPRLCGRGSRRALRDGFRR